MSNKCKGCNYINFGKINKYMFLVLLNALVYFILCFTGDQSKFYSDNNTHPIIYNISYSFGSSLSFILYIIYNRRNKSNINIINPLPTNQNNINQIKLKTKLLWILLVSIISYIYHFIQSIIWIDIDNYLNIWAFYIIFLSLFSYWILKMKLYKHHYVGIITVSIIGLLFNVITEKLSFDNIKNYYKFYLASIFNVILLSLILVLYKYYMFVKYIKSYEILFFGGLNELILSIITLIITTNIGYLDNFWEFYENLDKKEIIIFIFLTLINFFYILLIFIIIDIFSPFYIFLADFISENIYFFYIMDKLDLLTLIFCIIFVIFEIFMILVFIEVIELNFFGLSTMTKKNIESRAKLEVFEGDINNIILDKKIILDEYELEFINDEGKDKKMTSNS